MRQNASEIEKLEIEIDRSAEVFRNTGAGTRSRTPDLLITSQLLYRLSYTGYTACAPEFRKRYITELISRVQGSSY